MKAIYLRKRQLILIRKGKEIIGRFPATVVENTRTGATVLKDGRQVKLDPETDQYIYEVE